MIDTATNTVVAIVPLPAGAVPIGIAITPNGAFAYIANAVSNSLSVIDTSTNTLPGSLPVGSNPTGVAVTPDGAFVYVTNGFDNNVSVVSTATNTVAAIVPVGKNPRGVAFGTLTEDTIESLLLRCKR